MATIYYGIAGEGRGHATRALALIESLRTQHRLVLYTAGQAHAMLAPVYRGTDVAVRGVPELSFRYGPGQKLDYLQTGLASLPYLFDLPQTVDRLRRDMARERPDLVITDFEPALPRAARREGVPIVSVDHQHFLVACDLGALPAELRRYAAFMSPFVHAFCPFRTRMVVSSFFDAPLKPSHAHAVHAGVMIRPEIRAARPAHGGHLVAYLRRSTPAHVLEALDTLGREVRVYGLGAQPDRRRVRFFDIDPFRFVDDLASAEALVCTAGNQLVGEALFLDKPVFAMPEFGNFEQRINAFFLRQLRVGATVEVERVRPDHLHTFLERIEDHRAHIPASSACGNDVALAVIEDTLRRPEAITCVVPSRLRAPSGAATAATSMRPAF